MILTSPAFADGGEIPRAYTCEGGDRSPPLAWHGVPAGAKSLALIVDDPDAPDPKAPKMIWVHWLVYNLPPEATGLAEAVQVLSPGARQGVTDARSTGYHGPCPPVGRHRYYFKLYALDTMLPDLGKPRKPELLKAMGGHVLAEAQLMGTYQKHA
jgi:Raf kinase inhibitor-like YbhB/YbcL family protein